MCIFMCISIHIHSVSVRPSERLKRIGLKFIITHSPYSNRKNNFHKYIYEYDDTHKHVYTHTHIGGNKNPPNHILSASEGFEDLI